jgi:hypothetical protein
MRANATTKLANFFMMFLDMPMLFAGKRVNGFEMEVTWPELSLDMPSLLSALYVFELLAIYLFLSN